MLKPEEIRALVERAHEIHHTQQLRLEESDEVDSIVSAAEEAGVPREAMIQALRERLASTSVVLKEGDRVFAKSADGRFYAAEIRELGETHASVRFYMGHEARLPLADLRPLSLLPGQQLSAMWPNFGWWGATVASYDPIGLRVEVGDWIGTKAWVSLTDIRLEPEVDPASSKAKFQRAAAMVAVALGGGTLGSLVTYFLMR